MDWEQNIGGIEHNNIEDTEALARILDTKIGNQLAILSEAFKRTLQPLKSFFNCPLKFTSLKYKETKHSYWRFDFSWKSKLVWGSLLGLLIYNFACLYLGYRLISRSYYSSTKPGVESSVELDYDTESLCIAFVSSYVFTCCGNFTCSFFTVPNLVKFLDWKDFIEKFTEVFPNKIYANDFSTSNKLSRVTCKLSWIFLLVFFWWAVLAFHHCPVLLVTSGQVCSYVDIEQTLLYINAAMGNLTITLFEQCKLAVAMHTIGTAYSQIKMLAGDLDEDDSKLKKVLELIHIVRKQNKLLSHVAGPSQLFIFLFLFIATILGWLMVGSMLEGKFEDVNIPVFAIVFEAIQYARLIGFARLSETIIKEAEGEERLDIAFELFIVRAAKCQCHVELSIPEENEVLEMISRLKSKSMMTQVEIDIFTSYVRRRPSEFSIFNILKLQRSLLLSVFKTSAVYLIAILQFMDVQPLTRNLPLNGSNISQISLSPLD